MYNSSQEISEHNSDVRFSENWNSLLKLNYVCWYGHLLRKDINKALN